MSEDRRPATDGPAALTFPPDDWVLAERVRQVLETERPPDADAASTVVAQALRKTYPAISVRVRSTIAEFGRTAIYVFRDGAAVTSAAGEDWLDQPTTARLTTDASGTYAGANEAALSLLGRSSEEVLGHRAGEFTRPDARVVAADELWRRLERTGKLHSLALISRPDGTEVRVEFVTVRSPVDPGSSVTSLRVVTDAAPE